jgi:hypothetical protein
MAKRRKYKALAATASYYWFCGVLTILAGLFFVGIFVMAGINADDGPAMAMQFGYASIVFIVTVFSAISQIAIGESIELAMDVEGHLRESCEFQRMEYNLLLQDQN